MIVVIVDSLSVFAEKVVRLIRKDKKKKKGRKLKRRNL